MQLRLASRLIIAYAFAPENLTQSGRVESLAKQRETTMKILSAIEISCVFGANSMESQNCPQAEPWGFQQSGSGAYDQVKKAAERPWDPPLEERFPAKFDIVLGLIGGFFSIRERFANKAF